MQEAENHGQTRSDHGADMAGQQPVAAPPALDLSFLANYPPEQIAAIGQLFLSGAMQLPGAATTSITPQTVPPPQVSHNDQAAGQHTDLEDGEISDSEPLQANGVSQPSGNGQVVETIRSPTGQVLTNGKRARSVSSTDGRPRKRLLPVAFYVQQQQQLDSFIRLMYNSGYGFDSIKSHVSDQDKLSAVYQKLSLPTHQNRSARNVSAQVPEQVKPTTAVSKPAAPVAQDRQAYLERLQAAKNKKAETAVTQPKPSVTIPITAPPVRKGLDAEKSELLRQRLAALKAAQAGKEQLEATKSTTPDADQFLSNLGSSIPAREIFDSSASIDHSLVIENEESDSEIDESSLDEDSNNGVQLVSAQAAQSSSTNLSHPPSHSGSATPSNQTYEQTMHSLAEARRELAEMEQRRTSKLSEQHDTPLIAPQFEPESQFAEAVTTPSGGLGSVLPGLAAPQSMEIDAQISQPAHDTVADQHEVGSVASDASDFEEIYGEAPAHVPTSQPQVDAAETGEEDSEWTGTASDPELDDRGVRQVSSQLHSAAVEAPPAEMDHGESTDSCSMDMSEEEPEVTAYGAVPPGAKPSVLNGFPASTGTQQDVAATVDGQPLLENEQTSSHSTFRTTLQPYISALKALKRYRFHPHLAAEVPQAWRSPTWTHTASMSALVPADTKNVCMNHDCLPDHMHWEDYVISGGEYLYDLATNPGWDEEERQDWDKAMVLVKQELEQHMQAAGPKLTEIYEAILSKHAMAWSEQSLLRAASKFAPLNDPDVA